jgi:hypothetical protein
MGRLMHILCHHNFSKLCVVAITIRFVWHVKQLLSNHPGRCLTKHGPQQMQFKDEDGFELIPYHGTRKRALMEIL